MSTRRPGDFRKINHKRRRAREPVAQLVEHLTFNHVVPGSNPGGLTKFTFGEILSMDYVQLGSLSENELPPALDTRQDVEVDIFAPRMELLTINGRDVHLPVHEPLSMYDTHAFD